MFENLSDRLGGVFDRLTKQGALSEDDVNAALREVRTALLEADVSLPVARSFVKSVTQKATGAAVTKSVTPGQQVVKIVHDELIKVLQGEGAPDALRIDNPPAPVLMVGLQGSGKTTTTAKLALRLKDREKKRVLMASLDTNRPAAMEQLAILGTQIGVDTLPIVKGESAVQIAKRAKQQATLGGYDVYMLDTAGRLHIDEVLMDEVQAVRDIAQPRETLLVVDGLTGQDAVYVATEFDAKVGITGVVLTKLDGDSRGGAALSVRHVTGKPIKYAGVGEKLSGIEPFHPERMASRILGMGDVLSLIEEAQKGIDAQQAVDLAKKLKSGKGFDLNDFKEQIGQMRKMGGITSMMDKLPAQFAQAASHLPAGGEDKMVRRIEGIINSMTPGERSKPELIKASRKRRIASGAGVQVQEVNRLLNQFEQMQKMMKQFSKGGMAKLMRGMKGMLPGLR